MVATGRRWRTRSMVNSSPRAREPAGPRRRVPDQLAVDVHGDDPEFGYRFSPTSSARRPRHRRATGLAALRSAEAVLSDGAQGPQRQDHLGPLSTTTTSSATSPPPCRTRSGSPTSPSTRPPRATSTAARSRTCSAPHRGYALDERMTAQLAVNALRTAAASPTSGCGSSSRSSRRVRLGGCCRPTRRNRPARQAGRRRSMPGEVRRDATTQPLAPSARRRNADRLRRLPHLTGRPSR